MNVGAKALDKNGNLFDACREVTLRPDNRYEAELLAVLVRVTLNGGRLTLEGMERTTRITYGEWEEVHGKGGSKAS